MKKYQSCWSDREALDVFEATGPFAVEVPAELLRNLDRTRKKLRRLEEQVHALSQAPHIAETERRAAMTPKQRRDEDYRKAIARFEARANA